MKFKINIAQMLYVFMFMVLLNFLSIFTISTKKAHAQKIQVSVELQLDALPNEKRDKLINFKQVLEDYFTGKPV